MKVEISVGGQNQVLDFTGMNYRGLLQPKEPETSENLADMIEQALNTPIKTRPLRELAKPGQKVVIIATDITREFREDLLLPALAKELNAAGVKDEQITILVATGTHRPNNEEECRKMFGEEVMRRFRVVNHDAYDEEMLVKLGSTSHGFPITVNKIVAEADLKIATGCIEPHLFAGYSGGVKSVSVGVAGEETIAATHNAQILDDPRTRLGVIEGNIFRQFLEEAAAIVGLDFVLNVVLSPEKKIWKIVAGDPVQAHARGVEYARRLYEVEVDGTADIIVAVPGYPKDRDLYQATRAANSIVFGPRPFIKEGGVIIIPALCQDGVGHRGYLEWMSDVSSPEEALEKFYRVGCRPGEHKVFVMARIAKRAEVIVAGSSIGENALRQLLITPADHIEDALEKALRRLGPGASIWVMPRATVTIPVVKE
jgi:nickel-dependent lactate racemase